MWLIGAREARAKRRNPKAMCLPLSTDAKFVESFSGWAFAVLVPSSDELAPTL